MQNIMTRADEDILEDIRALFSHYPPLQHDRHAVHVHVERGVVNIEGYIKAIPTYRYLQDKLPRIRGVRFINADKLYNDDIVRLAIAKVLPLGVQVRVEYGTAILTGKLPSDMPVENVVERVAAINGVSRVLTTFEG